MQLRPLQIPPMNQPHQKHQQRVQAIELAVLADQLLLPIQDVLVDGFREEALGGDLQQVAHLAQAHEPRRPVAGQHVHQIDMHVVVAALVVVPLPFAV